MGYLHATVYVWRSKARFWESVLSFFMWISGTEPRLSGFVMRALT